MNFSKFHACCAKEFGAILYALVISKSFWESGKVEGAALHQNFDQKNTLPLILKDLGYAADR